MGRLSIDQAERSVSVSSDGTAVGVNRSRVSDARPSLAGAISPPQSLGEAVVDAVHEYRMRFKENPVGTNKEIASALTGGNPDEASVIGNPELKLSQEGELVDEWGTPFFLHQISGTQMDIRSAGPDRAMWTADDKEFR